MVNVPTDKKIPSNNIIQLDINHEKKKKKECSSIVHVIRRCRVRIAEIVGHSTTLQQQQLFSFEDIDLILEEFSETFAVSNYSKDADDILWIYSYVVDLISCNDVLHSMVCTRLCELVLAEIHQKKQTTSSSSPCMKFSFVPFRSVSFVSCVLKIERGGSCCSVVVKPSPNQRANCY